MKFAAYIWGMRKIQESRRRSQEIFDDPGLLSVEPLSFMSRHPVRLHGAQNRSVEPRSWFWAAGSGLDRCLFGRMGKQLTATHENTARAGEKAMMKSIVHKPSEPNERAEGGVFRCQDR